VVATQDRSLHHDPFTGSYRKTLHFSDIQSPRNRGTSVRGGEAILWGSGERSDEVDRPSSRHWSAQEALGTGDFKFAIIARVGKLSPWLVHSDDTCFPVQHVLVPAIFRLGIQDFEHSTPHEAGTR